VGERRSAVWMAPAPLQPGQTVELAFKVQVAPSARGLVINDKYEAIAEGWDEAVRGKSVITRIEAPTPTETPSPTPRLSPSPTPGLTPSPETQKGGTVARPAPTLTLTPVFSPAPGPERETGAAVVTSIPAPVPQSRRAGVGWWLVPLVFVVVVVVIAITWFTRVGRGGTDHEN
jgi:hypothetical protein